MCKRSECVAEPVVNPAKGCPDSGRICMCMCILGSKDKILGLDHNSPDTGHSC